MRLSKFVKSVDMAGGSPNWSITVDASEVEAALRKVQEDQVPSLILQYLDIVSKEARRVMVQFSSSPYIQRRTGRLVNSIGIFPTPQGYQVGPSMYYAKWVYGGHRIMRNGVEYGYVQGRPAHEWTAETMRDRAPSIALSIANRLIGGGS